MRCRQPAGRCELNLVFKTTDLRRQNHRQLQALTYCKPSSEYVLYCLTRREARDRRQSRYCAPGSGPNAFRFAYRGSRFDQVADLNAAVLIYAQDVYIIDLFIWPAKAEPIGIVSRDGHTLIYWTQGGLKFCAVSNMKPEDLSRFQEFFAAKLQPKTLCTKISGSAGRFSYCNPAL